LGSVSKGLIVLGTIFVLGAGLLAWKIKMDSSHQYGLNKITAEEIALILKDENPLQLKQLSQDAEQRKTLLKTFRDYFAIASEAKKQGLADDPANKAQLEEIRAIITARSYDQFKNKDKGPMPPFGFVTEDEVNAFYSDPVNEARFESSFSSQLESAKKAKRIPEDYTADEEAKKNERSMFAKIHIYEKEAEEQMKSGALSEEWKRKNELMVGLQQTQFLVSTYAQDTLKKRMEVTDADIKKYIEEHPELEPTEKKKKAEEILARVKAGEDFAKLAKEFSDDPGSNDKGGLYEGITKGSFVPEFEAATEKVEPGQIVDSVVETKFGYHIIKLEKRGETKGSDGQEKGTYDARHILISTGVKDPDNPMSREMPVADFVKAKLQKEKQESVLEEIKANNPVEVPDDFEVPQPSEEDLKKMEEKMKSMDEGSEDLPKGAPKAMPAKKK